MSIVCNLADTEQKEILKKFSGCLDAEEEDTIRGFFPQYLFFYNSAGDDSGYGDDAPVRMCYVTCCRQSFEGVRANYARGRIHNENVTCPICGKTLTGKAVHKFSYSMNTLQSWVKTAVAMPLPDGGLLIEAGNARRRFNWDDLDGEIDWYPNKRYYFNRGVVQMWNERVDNWAFCKEEVDINWHTSKTISEPFPPNMMGNAYYTGEYNIVGLESALDQSAFKYCQLIQYYKDFVGADLDCCETDKGMIKYLAQYALHPQIEMAVKFGLHEAVRDLVMDGKKNYRMLDWDATRPDAFLRMSKQDARLFINNDMDFQDLKNWREICGKISFSRFLSLTDSTGGTENMRKIAECAKKSGVTLEKAVRYVKSMGCCCWRGGGVPIGTIISTWKDYLDMALQLHYDMTEPTVAMPKDLQQRHDVAADIVKHQANEAELQKYKKRRRMLEKKYGFSMDGLCILIPKGSEEIVNEGRTLHHCVGGYAQRHIYGTTTILFLRHQKKPGRSFLTIELYEEKKQIKIRQIHGYRNENYALPGKTLSPREKYAWFLDVWLSWVNSGSRRDKEGRPILSESEDEKTA